MEVVQRLITLTALPEGRGWITSTHPTDHNQPSVISIAGDPQTAVIHVMHTHACR